MCVECGGTCGDQPLACHEQRTLARAGLAADPGYCDAGAVETAALHRSLGGPYGGAMTAALVRKGKAERSGRKTPADFLAGALNVIRQSPLPEETRRRMLEVTVDAVAGASSYSEAARAATRAVREEHAEQAAARRWRDHQVGVQAQAAAAAARVQAGIDDPCAISPRFSLIPGRQQAEREAAEEEARRLRAQLDRETKAAQDRRIAEMEEAYQRTARVPRVMGLPQNPASA